MGKAGQSRLEILEERLGMEALGRELRKYPPGSVAEPTPICSKNPTQAELYPPSSSSLRGNNNPQPRRDSAPSYGA